MIKCIVCNSSCKHFSAIPFNRNCLNLVVDNPIGQVDYYICNNCDHIHCHSMCAWDKETFIKYVYNDEYATIDPDFKFIRPDAYSKAFSILCGIPNRHLDYGCGEGMLNKMLIEKFGWNSLGYDPFYSLQCKPEGLFDLITAIEVLEHHPDPNLLIADIVKYMDKYSIFIFSTLTNDKGLYVAPRNGHISIFSEKSVRLLAKNHGLKYESPKGLTPPVHSFFKTRPKWARHLVQIY